jgi:general secretion pathway protein G
MLRRDSRPQTGFSLVEVLIVIVLMSVLAGIVVQNFLTITDDADLKLAMHNLGVFRGTVELYRGQHNGKLPPDSMLELLNSTDVEGQIGNSPSHRLGPYLLAIPGNPLTHSTRITAIKTDRPTKAQTNGGGWLYNPVSGRIWLDHPDSLDW